MNDDTWDPTPEDVERAFPPARKYADPEIAALTMLVCGLDKRIVALPSPGFGQAYPS